MSLFAMPDTDLRPVEVPRCQKSECRHSLHLKHAKTLLVCHPASCQLRSARSDQIQHGVNRSYATSQICEQYQVFSGSGNCTQPILTMFIRPLPLRPRALRRLCCAVAVGLAGRVGLQVRVPRRGEAVWVRRKAEHHTCPS